MSYLHPHGAAGLVLAALALAGCRCAGAGVSASAPPGARADPFAAAPPPAALAGAVRLTTVASGLESPTALAWMPGGGARLFVALKGGLAVELVGGKPAPEPLLDLRGRVSAGSEQGLLGLAFHPDFQAKRTLYVNYTDLDGHTHVVEYRVPEGAAAVDAASARELLLVRQPYANHNGGHVAFGPDGKLWVGLGDGGSANDPQENARNPRTFLGKMLRLAVEGDPNPEIVHSGLRNPWRYAFDRANGDLWIGDVGQNAWEEVSRAPAGARGLDFGWDVVEGDGHCVEARSCRTGGLTPPVLEYGHAQGCSITGGHVYRGRALPALAGHYFYADYCTGLLRSARLAGGRLAEHLEWGPVLDPEGRMRGVSTFGEDPDGELYAATLPGLLLKLEPKGP